MTNYVTSCDYEPCSPISGCILGPVLEVDLDLYIGT